ncbi:hypothetical protein ACXYMU_10240 [Pontibacter sp. CAU 1760]
MPYSVNERFLNIFEVLKSRGIIASQKEFSTLLDFPDQHFSGLRNGKRKVSLDMIAKLYKRFGINFTYILTGEGDMFGKGKLTDTINECRIESRKATNNFENCEQQLAVALVKIESLEMRLQEKDQQIAFLQGLLQK